VLGVLHGCKHLHLMMCAARLHPRQAAAGFCNGLCIVVQAPPTPFEEKLHAIAYINSNCGAQSGRSDIMRKLIALGDNAKVGHVSHVPTCHGDVTAVRQCGHTG
jgi:hypothetical protein